MAVYWVVRPLGVLPPAGLTAIETSVAEVTVTDAAAEMLVPICMAVMTTVPVKGAATPVTLPLDPAALPTDAIVASVENHETSPLRSCVLLSEKMPVAVSCLLNPLAMETEAG